MTGPRGEQPVKLKDVAAHAGVSAATVSRVLNGNPTVDSDLVERVQAVVAELAYRPNSVARNLRRSRTTLWAVIVSDIQNPFFTAVVRGIEDVARQAGYSVVLCNTDEDADKESTYVDMVRGEKMAGVILASAGRRETVRELAAAGIPAVVIDRRLDHLPVDTVLVDNEHGAWEATRHLLEGGYQRVACVAGPHQISTAEARLAGYRRALADAGRAYDDGLVRESDFRRSGGYDAMASLLTQEPPPDAVFVSNNLMAVGVLEQLADAGLTVPDDVAVVGFDDIPWADLVRPSITTVSQPTRELGRSSATLLLQRIAAPEREPVEVVHHTELHVRASSVRGTPS